MPKETKIDPNDWKPLVAVLAFFLLAFFAGLRVGQESVTQPECSGSWTQIEAWANDNLNCSQAVAYYNSESCDVDAVNDCFEDGMQIIYGKCNQEQTCLG